MWTVNTAINICHDTSLSDLGSPERRYINLSYYYYYWDQELNSGKACGIKLSLSPGGLGLLAAVMVGHCSECMCSHYLVFLRSRCPCGSSSWWAWRPSSWRTQQGAWTRTTRWGTSWSWRTTSTCRGSLGTTRWSGPMTTGRWRRGRGRCFCENCSLKKMDMFYCSIQPVF